MYVTLGYLKYETAGLYDLFHNLDIKDIVKHLGASYNVFSSSTFEFDLNEDIRKIQGANNYCLTHSYFIENCLFRNTGLLSHKKHTCLF
jgi:hypothetical protein